MERNWDLIREILRILAEKSHDDCGKWFDYGHFIEKLPSYHENVVKYHLKMMIEAGFVAGKDVSKMSGENYVITGMTWQGQDLWSKIKEKTVWEEIKECSKKNKIELSIYMIEKIYNILKEKINHK